MECDDVFCRLSDMTWEDVLNYAIHDNHLADEKYLAN